jgi:hypothetical protein
MPKIGKMPTGQPDLFSEEREQFSFLDYEKGGMAGRLYNADCLSVLLTLPDNSVDAVVTDPP